jgi:hypothetical protein
MVLIHSIVALLNFVEQFRGPSSVCGRGGQAPAGPTQRGPAWARRRGCRRGARITSKKRRWTRTTRGALHAAQDLKEVRVQEPVKGEHLLRPPHLPLGHHELTRRVGRGREHALPRSDAADAEQSGTDCSIT